MAAESAEFQELIGPEMTVDLDRLRDIAFYGIPDNERAEVWKVLLPALLAPSAPGTIASEDDQGQQVQQQHQQQQQQQQQLKQKQQQQQQQRLNESAPGIDSAAATTAAEAAVVPSVDDLRDEVALEEGLGSAVEGGQQDGLTSVELIRVLKSEMSRCARRTNYFRAVKAQTWIYDLIFDYIERSNSSTWHVHHAALVHAAAPFAKLMPTWSDAKTCFQHLLRALDAHFGADNGRTTIGRFLMLFRSRLPELFTHFEEEDIEAVRWASSWLPWLLCRELPFECCLRLWDSYFAAPDGHGFELHTFVCLAILENCQADLVELEHGEIVVFLQNLPALDMDRIIVQAQYMAHDFRTTELQALPSVNS
ncbi:TBC1 domain family member 22A [Hondaea fermentalgiana]|uniref:TBC1 domain family member 22A n=1 Tax=Hondaea fermentalgiana TaxID=2315210 RepID=A0A2R5GKI9_9STRA|nr:TBC1 domain family member 22A [Hondaea fermentalgiana]|eukprot:GBG31426.1 TBC1 domain family member 22A [Hondaea fermentalgiana]